ncbi:hypothetical protein HPB48_017265 [Haemaphysalis longicornis]|uniref:Uncharacterized protein n=1 Tax=Haemaphysalis longicornis TaxID=44386 RepID=A0A9J6FL73_HAELO|nr:hypothetical protein HPB48_017265 [Haemaphysalis longicornis]
MSDGEENKDPRIKTMLPKVAEAKVVVSTVALGSTADKKLEELALLAGGKAFSFQDLQGNLGLDMEAAFVEATTTQGGSIHQSQTVSQLLKRVSNRTQGLKEPHLLQVDSFATSSVLYTVPYLHLSLAQTNRLGGALRALYRLALGIPHYAASQGMLALGIHNIVEERIASHLQA